MAVETQVVVAEFRAKIDDYQAKIIQLEKDLNDFSNKEKSVADSQKQSSKELTSAAEKRRLAIKAETDELKKLQTGLKSAFTVPEIDTFNKKIQATKSNISTLKGEVSSAGNGLKELKSIALGIGEDIAAAFSIKAIIEFGKESVLQFRANELAAKKLQFAVVQVGGEGAESFKRLAEQAERLSKISIFSDNDIKNAQTQAVQFGLTADQVEVLIPKILDLASAQGITLAQANEILLAGINGVTRQLKPLGLDYKNTGDQVKNLAIFTEKLNKFQGASTEILNTGAGAAQNLGNQIEKLMVRIGGLIEGTGFLQEITFRINSFLDFVEDATASADAKAEAAFNKKITNFRKSDNLRRQFLLSEIEKELEFEKQRLANATDTSTIEGARTKLKIAGLISEQTEIKRIIALENGRAKNRLGLTPEEAARREALAIELAKKATEASKKIRDDEQKEINRLALVRIDLNDLIQKDATKMVEEGAKKELEINKEKNKDINESNQLRNKTELQLLIENEEAKIKAEKEAAEKRKQINEELKNQALSVANSLADDIFQIQERNLKREQDAELQDLQERHANATKSKRLTETQKDLINKEFAEKEKALRKKQFEQNKRQSEAEAAIKGALGIIATFAQYGFTPVGVIAAAALAVVTLAEEAVIASEKFAKGKRPNQKGGVSMVGEQGMETMFVPDNATILTHQKTVQHKGIIDSIMKGNLEQYLDQNYFLPRLQKHKKDFEESKQKSFVNNLSKSLFHLGLTEAGYERGRKKGININNVDEIAKAIAPFIQGTQSPYRKI